ncbi:MAG: phosphoribosylamine--glycine ligase [Candidatus Omnitrophica bacterium]|nr:phosphoribosylamine--glycine ligase [Candidatus Omnitrophota bacterium]
MKILVVGSGGREHALVWKLKSNPRVKKIYCAPGNGGIAALAECVDIKADDIVALADFAHQEKIDVTVVGPEASLVEGIVDLFEEEGLKVFGPSMAAARLEGSKVFAKNFMKRWDIPTARFATFRDATAALAYLADQAYPLVVKASGLAGGKGVVICKSRVEAEEAVGQIMNEKIFKDAGNNLVIEEFLEGEEASILAIADGKSFIVLESSQDHKRIFDDDLGPNTGGMGAYSPAPVVTPKILKQITDDIIRPVIEGMAEEESPFKGILYAGVMLTKDGPKVLEFNTRFGDPEAQAVLPRLKSDLLDVIMASIEGRLAGTELEWDTRPCVCVVMAAGGYPGNSASGREIKGLDQVSADAIVFHAGTKKVEDKIVTSGGRVLGVTAMGKDIGDALNRVYAQVHKITFEGVHFRKDIAKRALDRA